MNERDALKRENMELQELQAELAMWRARQQRLETLGVGAGHSTTTPSLSGWDRETHTRRADTGATLTTWARLGGPPRPTTRLADSTSGTSRHWTALPTGPVTVCTELPVPSSWAPTHVTAPVTSVAEASLPTMNLPRGTSTSDGVGSGELEDATTFPVVLTNHSPSQPVSLHPSTLGPQQQSIPVNLGQPTTISRAPVVCMGATDSAPMITMAHPGVATALPLSLMRPLRRIPPFSGDGQETGEVFADWLEYFENVANLAGWDDNWRLTHLTASLKDVAASFYRSCGGEVRNDYPSLLAAMKRRFTPVYLTAVQTQLFHNRMQGEKESVEQFAQDLRNLFNRAYAQATRDGPQAERMGQHAVGESICCGTSPRVETETNQR